MTVPSIGSGLRGFPGLLDLLDEAANAVRLSDHTLGEFREGDLQRRGDLRPRDRQRDDALHVPRWRRSAPRLPDDLPGECGLFLNLLLHFLDCRRGVFGVRLEDCRVESGRNGGRGKNSEHRDEPEEILKWPANHWSGGRNGCDRGERGTRSADGGSDARVATGRHAEGDGRLDILEFQPQFSLIASAGWPRKQLLHKAISHESSSTLQRASHTVAGHERSLRTPGRSRSAFAKISAGCARPSAR